MLFRSYRRDNNLLKSEMLADWIKIYQSTGRGISQWFKENRIRQVNLYAAGISGKLLTEELTSAGIEILNIFDRNLNKKCANFICCSPDSTSAEDREALTIITLSDDFGCLEVYEDLTKKGYRNIRFLSEIVKEFLSEHRLSVENKK